MNVDSGENLTGVLMPNVNGGAPPATVAGALLMTLTERSSTGRQRHISGRERSPKTRSRDQGRGVAEWVAHAPLVSDGGSDSCTGCDTGGKRRRPLPSVEVADCKDLRRRSRPVATLGRGAALRATAGHPGGTVLPNLGSPTLFPSDRLMTAAKADRISLQSIHET